MPDDSQAVEITKALTAKTEQRRLVWKSTYDKKRFLAVLPDGINFELAEGPELIMKDADGNRLFRLPSTPPPVGSAANLYPMDPVRRMLEDLYEMVRRQVLDIDEKLIAAKAVLERL